jgi:hypothetical protein
MSTVLEVENLTFTFDDSWIASKYDDWTFFRRKLSLMNAKGVDIVAVREGVLHLIEVKDYTDPQTEFIPLDELPHIFAAKCLDSLGGLLAASRSATGEEQNLARAAVGAGTVRLVLHTQLPLGKGGRLADTPKVIADLQTKLRMRVKGVDPHCVVESQTRQLGWWDFRRTMATTPSPSSVPGLSRR